MLPRAQPITIVLLALSAILLARVDARAEPLDKEKCSSLKVERGKLYTKEMRQALEQGPDWVKQHLDKEKIEHVRHFLKVEEQLAFRCRGGGVAKVKPPEMLLPDRKPEMPVVASAEAEAVGLPLKKPELPASETSEVKASQALADSDKRTTQ